MSEEKIPYKYNRFRDIYYAIFVDLNTFFKPFFDSYKNSKSTFFLQVINLTLVFLILKILFEGVLDKITNNVQAGNLVSYQIIILGAFTFIISAFKKNQILKWQTIFQMGKNLTIKFTGFFIGVLIMIYAVKHYNKDEGENYV